MPVQDKPEGTGSRAKAGWAAMQAATRYAVVFFAKLIFITISLRD